MWPEVFAVFSSFKMGQRQRTLDGICCLVVEIQLTADPMKWTQNITVIYNYFRKDNIVFAICIFITLIGSLVIIIKKQISRQIIRRIPKSNIVSQSTDNQEHSIEMATLHSAPRIIQVGLINKNNIRDLLLLC